MGLHPDHMIVRDMWQRALIIPPKDNKITHRQSTFSLQPPVNTGIRPSLTSSPKKTQNIFYRNSETTRERCNRGNKTTCHNACFFCFVFFCRYFIISNKDGGFHPILDLRDLNKTLKFLSFHMLRAADVLRTIEPQDWVVKVDLNNSPIMFYKGYSGIFAKFTDFGVIVLHHKGLCSRTIRRLGLLLYWQTYIRR